jgi:hypothetical protein
MPLLTISTQFMMDLELKLERPLRRHAIWSAIVMGLAYMLGGFSLSIFVYRSNAFKVAYFL